jgi:ribonuclease M5
MKKIKEVILVEGKYDKIKLDSVVDALVITCDGFGIYKQKDKLNLLKDLAEKRGLIILTDSDSAGFMIRSRIKGYIDNKYIKNAYIPDIYGKEKRKTKAGKEGKLGVEGMPNEVILKALEDAGVNSREDLENPITNYDLYNLGLYGKDNSANKREELQKMLGLPSRLSKKSLLEVLNIKLTLEELKNLTEQL